MIFSNNDAHTLNNSSEKVLILPLGAIEQHGPHLPTGTDTQIASALAAALEQALPSELVLCPTLAFGASNHHLDFGGTLSISAALYTELLVNLVDSAVKSGFQKIVLLNGHGGNITPAKQALSVLSSQLDKDPPPNIALVTYWEIAGKPFAGQPPMESPALSHACEYETSLMLHLFPETVHKNRIERCQRPPMNNYVGWEDDLPYRGVSIMKPTAFISSNGSSGEPQLGTAEKGNFLFTAALNALVDFIKDFQQWSLMERIQKK